MSASDRTTPIDPHRVARVPRPAPREASDEQRVAFDEESVRRRLRPTARPPLQERKQTPVSGGVEAQPQREIHVEIAPDPTPRSLPPTRSDWAKLRFKLYSAIVAGLIAVIGAAAYFGVTFFNAQAEAQRATKAAKVATSTGDDALKRIAALEAYLKAKAERDECLGKQARDAFVRGTGHVITSLPKGGVEWVEQNAPKPVPRTLWAKPTWFTTEPCPTDPAVPKPP